MADKRTTPEAPGSGRRKRAAPTIDLKATEVATEAGAPAQDTAAPDASAEAPQPTAKPAATATPRHTRRDEDTVSDGARPPAPEREETASPPPPPPPRRADLGGAIAGGIVGAIVAAAAMGGLWTSGLIPSRSADDGTGALQARVAALQNQVQDLQNRPPPSAADTGAIDRSIAALGQRIDRLEQAIANLPPGEKSVADRLAAADNAMKSLGIALAALNRRSDDIAAKAAQAQEQAAAAEKSINDLRASVQSVSQQASSAVEPGQLNDVRQRIASLEQSVESVRADFDRSIKTLDGRISQAGAADRAARLALSASVLQTKVASGAPYASELAQAKSLGADQQALAPLDRFAASGIPDTSALAEQLLDVVVAMRKAAGAAEAGTFLDRLQANASKLVRVRPVEAPAGDAPADLLARIEADAAQGNIANALADLGRLPPPVRAPAQAWIARAKARQDALTAAQRFAAETARALGNG
jgi:hypothetical protein